MASFDSALLNYETVFAAYLDPNEKLLWVGRPRQGLFLRSSDALMIPFSVLWGGFAIFWELGVSGSIGNVSRPGGAGDVFGSIWGVPFVLVGLYMMVGRFFFDAWQRRITSYAITENRALIVRSGLQLKVTSYDLRSIGEVNFQKHSDGSGTLTFGKPVPVFGHESGINTPCNIFDHVPDALVAFQTTRACLRSG